MSRRFESFSYYRIHGRVWIYDTTNSIEHTAATHIVAVYPRYQEGIDYWRNRVASDYMIAKLDHYQKLSRTIRWWHFLVTWCLF